MAQAAKPIWAGQHLRLDPERLPQTVSYAASGSDAHVTFTLDTRGAVLRRQLTLSGLPLSVALPKNVFRGVAARAIEGENGDATVTLELLHTDPELSVPLLVAENLNDVAADWRLWAEIYGMPMLLIEKDGVARTLEESLDRASAALPRERRPRSQFANRRPRFLCRRNGGDLGMRLVVKGREIIPHG